MIAPVAVPRVQTNGGAMKQVGKMFYKFGPGNNASTVVDEQGRFWWFSHPFHLDLESASKLHEWNGPFESQGAAEEHFRVTTNWPANVDTAIKRRKGR